MKIPIVCLLPRGSDRQNKGKYFMIGYDICYRLMGQYLVGRMGFDC